MTASYMTDDIVLRTSGLTKGYGDFTLNDVSIEVPAQTVVGLIGQNGAGKTTLMKLILGATHTDAGTIELYGHDMTSARGGEISAAKAHMAFVSSVCPYPIRFSVRDVTKLYELVYPKFDRAAFDSLCRRLGFSATKSVGELSRGMGMKLQLACAMASGAELLLLDEPTAGLDPIVRDETLGVLGEWMTEGERSILISSHITTDLEKIADSLVLLHEGRVMLSCARDVFDAMGVARLREAELTAVSEDGFIAPKDMHVRKRDFSYELLVPDRAEFMRAYPDLVCDPVSIDELMGLLLKGRVS